MPRFAESRPRSRNPRLPLLRILPEKGFIIRNSRMSFLIADDSGLAVPSLGGAPGVHSARYAGPNASDADRVQKLLEEMRGRSGDERRARFVCVLTLAQQGRALAVFSDSVEGVIVAEPRGGGGFGYDPIFYFPKLYRTYAEITRKEKNEYSHRGRAFRKLLQFLASSGSRDFI